MTSGFCLRNNFGARAEKNEAKRVKNGDIIVHSTIGKAKHFHSIHFRACNRLKHLLAIDTDYTRPVVVHLYTLDLEDVVSWRWTTTPASTVCPVVPANRVSTSSQLAKGSNNKHPAGKSTERRREELNLPNHTPRHRGHIRLHSTHILPINVKLGGTFQPVKPILVEASRHASRRLCVEC
jgi:hypothetical protein